MAAEQPDSLAARETHETVQRVDPRAMRGFSVMRIPLSPNQSFGTPQGRSNGPFSLLSRYPYGTDPKFDAADPMLI